MFEAITHNCDEPIHIQSFSKGRSGPDRDRTISSVIPDLLTRQPLYFLLCSFLDCEDRDFLPDHRSQIENFLDVLFFKRQADDSSFWNSFQPSVDLHELHRSSPTLHSFDSFSAGSDTKQKAIGEWVNFRKKCKRAID